MIDKNSQDYKDGQKMFLDNIKYNSPAMKTNNHYAGWTDMERSTRCGFELYEWSRSGSIISY